MSNILNEEIKKNLYGIVQENIDVSILENLSKSQISVGALNGMEIGTHT